MVKNSHGKRNSRPGSGPPESAALRDLAREILVDPETWFNTENFHLGGQKPITLIEKGEEEPVYELLHGIKYGAFS